MGQAKNRGTAAQRQAEAIEAGRIKTSATQAFHSMPSFELKGYKKPLIEQLTTRSNASSVIGAATIQSPPPEPFHQMAETTMASPEELDLPGPPFGG
jgi:hypothetical protein